MIDNVRGRVAVEASLSFPPIHFFENVVKSYGFERIGLNLCFETVRFDMRSANAL